MLRYVLAVEAGLAQLLCGAAGGEELGAEAGEVRAQLDYTSLIGDGDESALGYDGIDVVA